MGAVAVVEVDDGVEGPGSGADGPYPCVKISFRVQLDERAGDLSPSAMDGPAEELLEYSQVSEKPVTRTSECSLLPTSRLSGTDGLAFRSQIDR